MEETELIKLRVGPCRRALAKRLQSPIVRTIQAGLLTCYFLVYMAECICFDVAFKYRQHEYITPRDDGYAFVSRSTTAMSAILIAELAVLAIIQVDVLLRTISYAKLYWARFSAIMRQILLLANACLLVAFLTNRYNRYQLFGTKMLLGALYMLG